MTRTTLVLASVLSMGVASDADQDKEATSHKPTTPLRVVLTVSRFDGEKKVGSLPYTLQVDANNPRGVKLRMGVEVPVPVTTFANAQGPAGPAPPTSFQYRNVGTNIDCSADSLDDGRFRVLLTVEQSSIQSAPERKAGQALELPMFRTFNAIVPVILRDGQTIQYVSATDPVNGEIVRLDVALTVLK